MEARTTDIKFLRQTRELAKQCVPSATAFSVGAVIVGADARVISTGYSRETNPQIHAEEVAIAKAYALGEPLLNATLYSSLEPCGERLSGNEPCAEKIIAAGITRVVYAQPELPTFVKPQGAARLTAAGVLVEQIDIPEGSALE